MTRLAHIFKALKAKNRAAFTPYFMAGDPDIGATPGIMHAVVAGGADIIELGMPFTDPAAEGPIIQAAASRALKAGASLKTTLQNVKEFRVKNTHTPIILMGYYNPIFRYGSDAFCRDAAHAGADALLIVDIPPEEAEELSHQAREAGLDFVRLIAPTSGQDRIEKIARQATGFLYYVSITGITGTKAIDTNDLQDKIDSIRAISDLPVCVGFGIRTPDDARAVAQRADGVIIGSALVRQIADCNDRSQLFETVKEFTSEYAAAMSKS